MAFAKDYYKNKGYRSNLLYVGYWISRDQQALLSYSWDGDVMTIDPVSTANKGWREFLLEYNKFCMERDGKPLFNQTFGFTKGIVAKAFGARLQTMIDACREHDPEGRLMNQYFNGLLT